MKEQFNKGLLLTSVGSFWWGFIGVLYFKYVSFIGHVELVVHRCLWTAVMLILTTTFIKKWKFFFRVISNKKNLIALFLSGLVNFYKLGCLDLC
jgi:Predicted permeases